MNSTGETSMKKNGTLKPTFAEILRRPPLRRGTDIRRAPLGRDPEGDRETRQSKLGVEELDYFQNRWEIINRGVAKIKNIAQGLPGAKFTSEEYMNLYATMYHCGSVRKQLDEKYMDTCEDHVKATVLPSLRKKSDEFMLRDLVQRWTTHQLMVRWLLRFFDYENHNDIHVPYSKLKVAGLTIFRAMVYQELKAKLADAVISVIDRAREGEQVHWDLLTNVLDIFIGNGAGYRTYEGIDLENSILKGSATYYLRKASKWMVEYSCPNYILKVEECLKREDDLFYHIVHLVSRGNLRTKLKHELLSAYATMLENENTGCNVLLRNEKVRDLSTIFRCLPQIPRGLEIVSNSFKLHVTARCTALVKQAENSANKKAVKRDGGGLREHVFVRGVIELHDKFLGYVNGCFENHLLFHKALKEAFIILCSKGVSGSSNAELFASFCDNILQKGENERLSSKAITDTLEKVVKLLAYINDKDLFAEFYRKRLSRRLLFDKSSNLELERSILTRLKQEFGVLFTSKMEGMVTDFTLARENQIMFKEYLRPNPNQNASPGIDLAVTVLTTGFWPTYKTFDLNLPAEMATCVCAYKEFYLTNTKHRKLTFIYSLGTCNINGRFDEKTIELNVTTYQAATLLLFNTSDRLSYREIVTQLNLPDDDVVRLLHSLSCGRYKILSKQPDTKTISPTDTFEYNSKFTDKMRRIKIPLPPVVVDEKKKVIEDVNKDRRYSIDASIVRIMKSRKVLGYQQLISECVEQLSCTFKPDVKAIKKRIEDLIELEFLERDEDNPSIFKYLA